MSDRLTEAKKYLERDEISDRSYLNGLLGMDPAKQAWCAAFVTAIERKVGAKGTGSLAARSYLKYGEKVSVPEPGDIVVFRRGLSNWQGHVAYYIADDGDTIHVLGGNQDNKVCIKNYPKSRVLGYRRGIAE